MTATPPPPASYPPQQTLLSLPAACRLPIVSGDPCKVTFWAFDASRGKCITFEGCGGNANKFYLEKECQEYCGVFPSGTVLPLVGSASGKQTFSSKTQEFPIWGCDLGGTPSRERDKNGGGPL